MAHRHDLACACGQVKLQLAGPPIASVECLCTSCRKAGRLLETLPGAPAIVDGRGATGFVMQRKDRVAIVAGAEHLSAFRLSPEAGTRRIVAACCNTPVWLDFPGGHWLSVYAGLWKPEDRPPLEMRTMVGDAPDPAALPDDVPNLKRHSLGFYARLIRAWIRMGFRSPKFPVKRELYA